MNPTGNHYYQHRAHGRRHNNWQPLRFDDVKIEHQRYRCRNKKESEILMKLLNQKNIKELRKNGIIVNLSPDFNVILERLSHAKDSRPLLKGSDIEGIHQRFIDRLSYYAVCDYKIKVSNEYGPEHFAKEIVKLIQP